ncbi:MAG: Eco57I restriction-modification methylase domain-containing protein [Magnetococcales bacterium]|nr:Eco57I restriction-modification methylase domain-containing protein [Magnetococcales bacterium]
MAMADVAERGAFFTRNSVVEFILDLAGYTVDQPLHRFRLLEPSFGRGNFLHVAVDRLLTSFLDHEGWDGSLHEKLAPSIQAVELHPSSIEETRSRLMELMIEKGINRKDAVQLIDAWIVEGDFLLAQFPHPFTHIVGNPPYVRQEHVPDILMEEYRFRYDTIFDRADLYIPFIERSLHSLDAGGKLAFICSDRWMKNRYGGPLRAMVANGYHLACYIDMVDTQAFHEDVTAYPAITLITREKAGRTRVVHRPETDSGTLSRLAKSLNVESLPKSSEVLEIRDVARGQEPWILHSADQLAVIRRLEKELPLLEEVGCRVGIGVATGADKVFIGPFEALDVEPDRKLPLVQTKDIKGGCVAWQGQGVINPFNNDGTLVDLRQYPKLADYLSKHEEVIRNRHCARKNPGGWYRTIDRIHPDLLSRPKLLIPDIKGDAHIIYDDGAFYPHHNLYFITSDQWDLQALRGVLLSGIARLFVSLYSIQMRGGYLRFQAQYLRRIRVPKWGDVSHGTRKSLVAAATENDYDACSRATFGLYGLSQEESAVIGGNREDVVP